MLPMKIMLVDDEVPFVEAMSRRLAKRGLNVSTAFSGQEALDALSSGQSPDVIILDVKMPGLGGLETLSAIKKSHPAVEVIMLTGHGTIESAVEGVRLGAFDYLTKPCDLEALLGKIQAAERKKRQTETQMHEARARMHTIRRGD